MKAAIASQMIAAIRDTLVDRKHVAVGASSPLPACAALLAQFHNADLRVSILGSEEDNPFTDGGRELFDCAAQGRIDTFFFSGVQIDANGNVNLLGRGSPPRMSRRFMGNFGAPYLAGLIPNIILFRTDHSQKSLVEQVEFISAPGRNVRLLVTDKAVFGRTDGRFHLISTHADETIATIRHSTGFEFEGDPITTPGLSQQDQTCLYETILPRMHRLYPAFVDSMTDHTRSMTPRTKS